MATSQLKYKYSIYNWWGLHISLAIFMRVEGHILPGTYTPFAGMNVRELRVGRAEACAVGGGSRE